MSSLFDNTQFQKKLKDYNLHSCAELKSILTRWHALLSTTTKNEEQLQTDFLNDIFGDILGYTYKRGEAETNLEKEEKTELDGQKPDGILGFFNEKGKDVRVIIELKDQKTDLDKKQNRATDKRSPVEQAFGYVSKCQGVEWVIVSNFKEIRLYKAGYAGKYHAFTMEELASNIDKQKEFHFLLSKDRLFTKTPNQSPVHSLDTAEKGEEIEKRFYKHYSTLREEIWHNLLDLNKEKHYGRNFYLYKAQKLIDRIIFIRFCKENGALDNDAVLEALNNKYIKGKYNRMKALFTAMDEGNPEIGIAKFNGGLFAEDKDLDCLNISDEIIDKIVILYSHDFGSDLDVNILGHIFEQSISDLENLTGDNEKKRKKDGVFYTPAYITEYIVREAVGGWLADRKTEIKAKEGTKDWWQQYANSLKSIKVLDPACGSGAFLVKVFDYLQNEWREIHKHIKTDWNYKDILTHNIYGVDINPASTGITKLSLWLKTAHYREPLTTLDGNIKIGNSLIDNPDIAGYYSEFEGKVIQEVIAKDLFNATDLEKLTAEGVKKSLAFKWSEEFKEVFGAGGFDVVVGNPPYVPTEFISATDKIYFEKHYKSAFGRMNVYTMFYEKGITLLESNGYIGYITPYTLLKNQYYIETRRLILNNTSVKHIVEFEGKKVFETASVDPVILVLKKEKNKDNETAFIKNIEQSERIQKTYTKQVNFLNKEDLALCIENDIQIKCLIGSDKLGDIVDFNQGIITGNNKVYITNNKSELSKKVLKGEDFNRYTVHYNNLYVLYDVEKLHRARKKEIFETPAKILLRQTGDYPIAAIDREQFYTIDSVHNGIVINQQYNIEYLLCLINSKLMRFLYDATINEAGKIFSQVKIIYVNQLPIKKASKEEQTPFTTHAQKMLDLTKQFNELSNKFTKLLGADLGVAKITKKLEKWYNLQADEFFTEVGKQNKNLSLSQKSQWLDHFEAEKQRTLALQSKITKTDAEIDKMVYALYGLSEEEIGVVEDLVV